MQVLRNNRSGFTLVELLIVVAIAGILATMSYSYMIAAKPHAELERAELQLTSYLAQARNHAISEEVTTRVVFDVTTDTFKTEVQDPSTGSWTQQGPTQDLTDGITFTGGGVTLANGEARFTPRGTLHWGGAITIVASNGESSVLTANLATGRFPVSGGNLR